MIPNLITGDWLALSPFLIVLCGALVVLLLEAFSDVWSKRLASIVTLGTLLLSAYLAVIPFRSENALLVSWLRFDWLAHFLAFLFAVIGIATTLLSQAFFKRFETSQGEFYFLLLSSIFGLQLIAYSADFLTLFVGLETLSISLYVLCGYMKRWQISHEAAMKYFLMGALAAAFLLYGIALIYGAIGSTSFATLADGYHSLSTTADQVLFMGGIALVTVGFAFKAAIVPFHVWAPDVYDGAPTPVTAFMAVGTKVGAFAAMAIVFLLSLPNFNHVWNDAIALLAFPTLIYANYVALRQTQLRRFFAYSGISHAGFLLIPFAAQTPNSLATLIIYLVIYSLATLGCFAVLAFIDSREEGVILSDLHGLYRRSPLLAGTLTLCLLTLAGIPPTAGFIAKLMVFKLAYETGYYALLIVALLTTVLSAYYYLRIVTVLFAEAPNEATVPRQTWSAATVALFCVVGIILLSIFPNF